jgi:hypothetical protein
MSDPQPQVDPPQSDSSAAQQRRAMADGARPLPAWNRERLIDQFQQIDASTRSEAERQIAAFELSFESRISDLLGTGPPRAGSRKSRRKPRFEFAPT